MSRQDISFKQMRAEVILFVVSFVALNLIGNAIWDWAASVSIHLALLATFVWAFVTVYLMNQLMRLVHSTREGK